MKQLAEGQERARWETVLTVVDEGKQDSMETIRHYAEAYGKINDLSQDEVEQVANKVYHQLNAKTPEPPAWLKAYWKAE